MSQSKIDHREIDIENFIDFFIKNSKNLNKTSFIEAVMKKMGIKDDFIKKRLKDDFFTICKYLDSPEKVLLFSPNETYREIFSTYVYRLFKYPSHVAKNTQEIILHGFYVSYRIILLDTDPIFHSVNNIIDSIRNEKSKNKETLINLLSSDKNHFSKLHTLFAKDEKTHILGPYTEEEISDSFSFLFPKKYHSNRGD